MQARFPNIATTSNVWRIDGAGLRDGLIGGAWNGVLDDAPLTAMDHASHSACAQAASKWGNTAGNAVADASAIAVSDASANASFDAVANTTPKHTHSCAGTPITTDIEHIVHRPPQPFATQSVADIKQSDEPLEVSSTDVTRCASRNAFYLARVAPTATIFVRCKEGIIRNEIESTRPTHREADRNVLRPVMPNAPTNAPTNAPSNAPSNEETSRA